MFVPRLSWNTHIKIYIMTLLALIMILFDDWIAYNLKQRTILNIIIIFCLRFVN